MTSWFKLLILSLLLSLSSIVLAEDSLTANIDRTQVAVGETFQLTLTLNGEEAGNPPDFQRLEKNFSIMGISQAQQTHRVNGESTHTTEWTLILSPKEKGTFTIPAFIIGQLTSAPLTLNVEDSAVTVDDPNNENRDVFFTTNFTPESPYVQSQGIYTVSLYYNKTIDNVQFIEPHGDKLTLFHLGQDKQFSKTIQGKTYQVLERRYAVIPQKSGELILEGGGLVGQIWKGQSQKAFYIARPEPITLTANPVTIQVKPMPLEAQKTGWLPAEELTVSETWSPMSPQWEVGQPVTRTITVEAIGLIAEQLPAITLDNLPGMQIYAEKPSLQSSTDGKTLLAKRVEKFILIPTKADNIKFPPIEIHWWSLRKKASQVTRIPGKEQTVGAGSGVQPSSPPAENLAAVSSSESVIQLKQSEPFWKTDSLWRWIALFAVIGWALTLFFMAWMRKRKKITPHPLKEISLRTARDRLKQACAQNNLQEAKTALVEWAILVWPKLTFRSLGDVEKQISDLKCKAAVAKLDKMLYTQQSADGQSVAWDGQGFWEMIASELTRTRKKSKPSKGQDDGLPALYPERE